MLVGRTRGLFIFFSRLRFRGARSAHVRRVPHRLIRNFLMYFLYTTNNTMLVINYRFFGEDAFTPQLRSSADRTSDISRFGRVLLRMVRFIGNDSRHVNAGAIPRGVDVIPAVIANSILTHFLTILILRNTMR